MMTSFAKTQSETLFELMKQNPSIASVLVAYPVAQQTKKVDQKPDNGNDLVLLGGRVSEGMVESLGLEIDNKAELRARCAARVSMLLLLVLCGSGIQLRIGFSDVFFT